MIKVAILDDEKQWIKKIKKLTENSLEPKTPCEVQGYTNFQQLMLALEENEYFDLYFLDMEMPDTNGLEVARAIRQQFIEPVIIYVTNHLSYAVQAFEVNAYRYIPKAMLEEKLPEAIAALLPSIEKKDERIYTVQTNVTAETILFRDIYVLQKDGKYVIIHHRHGNTRVRKTLEQIYQEIKGDEFVRIDKSNVINLIHTMSIGSRQVRMRNGMRLSVSQSRFMAVKKLFVEYWDKRGIL